MKVLITILFLIAYIISVAVCVCPNGWVRYDSSCYLFEDTLQSWHAAKTYCEGLNAHLVRPTTPREINFIEGTLRKMHTFCAANYYYWMGGNDIAVENDWVWASIGETITFTDWAPGEPNGVRLANCMQFHGSANFQWDDAPCDTPHRFICEKEMQDTELIG